ncbi:hypothetical protein Bca52824_077957 [Brassica carinata]|uniref:Uncharacterized protein n=1 Tax=Brassica carinata TaxID=52824 RepID=A0A8X7PY82_BRACI|nr:hypothetical protein Bca52824_077957 [Brassica carinata]
MAIRWRFSPSLWLLSTERRELYWCSSATKENHDLSIGGSSRPWKTAAAAKAVIYLSIGSRHVIWDLVAVEPNRKLVRRRWFRMVILKSFRVCGQ